MTISTTNERKISISFFVFNFVIFFVLNFLVLNKFFESKSGVFVYMTMIISALVTGCMYILIDISFTCFLEGRTIAKSKYVAEYSCSIFTDYNKVCILILKYNRCDVYINQLYFLLDNCQSHRVLYLSKLKSRFLTLNKIDILYIYLYKYIDSVLMSVLLFIIWQFYSGMSVYNNYINKVVIISCTIVLALPIYYVATKICMVFITKVMQKRNLKMFTFE